MGFPSCSPSLTPCTPHPRGQRDSSTSHPISVPCPSSSELQLEPLLPRASCAPPAQDPLPKTAFPWYLGRRFPAPGTSLPTVGSLPGEDRGAGQPLELAGPKGGCYCYFPAWKETL